MKSIKLNIFLYIILSILSAPVYSTPYQLINGESALMIPHFNLEVKEDIIYSMGYIDDWGIRSQLRWGIKDRVEISFSGSFNYFSGIQGPSDLYLDFYKKQGHTSDDIDLDNPRLSYVEPKIKVKTIDFLKGNPLMVYAKYKHSFGNPLVVPYPEDGNDDNAVAVTTPNAYQGKDITIGSVTMFKFPMISKREHIRPFITAGIEGVYLWGKNWMEERRDSHVMFVANFSPAIILFKYWMFQVENRFEWWYGRGLHYEVLPGIRYEIQSKTIIETGIGLPVMGGDIKRIFLGFTYEFGKTKMIDIK